MIKAKKSLGQNFLIDQNIIKIIINSSSITNKTILEVGPGTGNLTKAILNKKPKKLYVVEKDNNLSNLLVKNLGNEIIVINKDILKLEENSISNDKFIVFGNLPYNISTEILCKWILNLKEDNFWFEELILMFQKEVAERILAKINTSNYGRLTILANWKLNIKKICDVSHNCFYPKPRIESTLLHFSPKTDFFKIIDGKNLEKITKIFFNHRRKMIKKPFNEIFKSNYKILDKLKINLNSRPQNLDMLTYYNLTQEYENLRS